MVSLVTLRESSSSPRRSISNSASATRRDVFGAENTTFALTTDRRDCYALRGAPVLGKRPFGGRRGSQKTNTSFWESVVTKVVGGSFSEGRSHREHVQP